VIERLRKKSCRISVMKSAPLAAVTVNPFYPKKKDSAEEYTSDYLDAHSLLGTIRRAFSGPVFDMKQPGSGSRLLRVLKTKPPEL